MPAVSAEVLPVTNNAVTLVAGAIAPAPILVAPAATAVGPVSEVSALVQGVPTSSAGVVVPLTQQQFDIVSFLVGSDVSALIQGVLISGAAVVVPLTVLQSDMYSFLVDIAGMDPVVAAVTLTWIQSHLGGVVGAGLSATPDTSGGSIWRLVLPFARMPGGPLAGDPAGVATLHGDCGPFAVDD